MLHRRRTWTIQSYSPGDTNADPHLTIMLPGTHPNPQPKPHLDWFSRFAWLTTVTDRQTDRPRYSVYNNRPHLYTALRCSLKSKSPQSTLRIKIWTTFAWHKSSSVSRSCMRQRWLKVVLHVSSLLPAAWCPDREVLSSIIPPGSCACSRPSLSHCTTWNRGEWRKEEGGREPGWFQVIKRHAP